MMTTTTNTFARIGARATNWLIPLKLTSLRVRLALLAALLLCLIQAGLSTAFYGFTATWLLNQVDYALVTTGTHVVAALNDTEPLAEEDLHFPLAAGNPLTAALLNERAFFLRVIDAETGAIVNASGGDAVPITPVADEALALTPNFATFDTPEATMRVYTSPFTNSDRFMLQVGQSLDQVEGTQVQIARLLLIMLLATAILALISGWLLAQQALRPVTAIARTAEAVGEHDLSRRISAPLPADELGQLAHIFNRMLDRVEAAFRRQQQFTADAAHELRSPLAIMQTGLEVTLAQPRSADDYRAVLESQQDEVLRLAHLTNQLLMLARADAYTLPFEPRRMNLSLMLSAVADQVALTAEQKQITLVRALPPDVIISADEDRLIQLTLNLLDNAVKYTPAGGTITLSVTQSAAGTRLSVRDTGIGIPADHLPHIFDRFYRVDRVRTSPGGRQLGGLGLGLAIAKQIADLHGAVISVTSEPGAGSEFSVTFPTS